MILSRFATLDVSLILKVSLLQCKGLGCKEFPAPATNWTGTRANLTLSFSSDGIAWRRLVHIWPGNATYSSLTDLGSGLVGCLYDQGEHER